MIEHALRYINAGLYVFPLAAGTKIPVRGSHGYKSASVDPNQARQWWGRYPQANVAIATSRSGLVVIDLDLKNGVDGFASLDAIARRLGFDLPRTKMASTPNGGAHLYFRTEAKLKNGAAAPGLDVCVHQITAPPSTVNGKAYRWDVFDVPTAPLPEAWVEEFKAPPPYMPPEVPTDAPRDLNRYMRAAIEREAETLAHAGEGTRNQALCRFGFVLATIPEMPPSEIRRAAQGVIASWQWTHARPNHRKNVNTLERGIKEGRARPRGRT